MESREFFRRARKLTADLGQPFVVVRSKETADGGQAGVLSFVNAETAARLILRDLAELATKPQADDYFAADATRRAAFEAEQMRDRIHVALANNFTSELVTNALTPPAGKPKA
jgi:hypothetical protein